MYSKKTIITNPSGLHARPASTFVKCATSFTSKIQIGRLGDPARTNAKSIILLLSLALTQGTQVEISATGEDEQQAVDTLANLIESGCGE